MAQFSKTICPGYDEIELSSFRDSDWLTITMRVGNDTHDVVMTIRSNESVRDFHYALGRYVAVMEEEERRIEAVRNRK